MSIERTFRFPGERDLPPGVALPGPVEQREYLVGGELRHWDGPMQDVVSPVWTEGAAGPAPRVIGACPLLDEAEALRALDAAARRLRPRPRRLADHVGRGAHPPASRTSPAA